MSQTAPSWGCMTIKKEKMMLGIDQQQESIKGLLRWVADNANGKLSIFKRAFDQTDKSKANRIKAKCLDCCSCMVDEVKHCEAYACPLWQIRPYQTK